MVTTMMRGLTMSTFLICAVPAFADSTAAVTPVAPGMMGTTKMGAALYTRETDAGGKSTCYGDCAATWIPLIVANGAEPVQDWSVVLRKDGSRMWAYKGQPVYTYVLDKQPGQVSGEGKAGFHLAGLSDEDRAALGRSSYAVATMGVTTAGPAWVDSRGMALYTFEKDTDIKSMCSGNCAVEWPPLKAVDGAVPTADWTLVARDDGSKMWAYKGHPLYTYRGDMAPGQVNGDNMGGFHLAL